MRSSTFSGSKDYKAIPGKQGMSEGEQQRAGQLVELCMIHVCWWSQRSVHTRTALGESSHQFI